jgi:hypothetical protein
VTQTGHLLEGTASEILLHGLDGVGTSLLFLTAVFVWVTLFGGDRGSTVVKVLRYKSEGRWFDPRWC